MIASYTSHDSTYTPRYYYSPSIWELALAHLDFVIAQAKRWRELLEAVLKRKQSLHIFPTRCFKCAKKLFRRTFQPRWSSLRWRSTT
jgi:hypothetical protein